MFYIMRIKVDAQLKKLAKILDGDLYIVGGAVRNAILGKKNTDVDLTGSKTPEEVIALLEKHAIKYVCPYASFGSVLIVLKDKTYEYTTFRKDSYLLGHKPSCVEYVKTVEEDCKRRDFTVNAIYYNVKNRQVVDCLGGVKDLKAGVLKACNGEQTFKEDGLRILRMIRFYGELGFEIESQTLEFAKKYVFNLANITAERKREEIDKILISDLRYNKTPNPKRLHDTLMLMEEVGATKYLFPGLEKGVGMYQNEQYHAFDVFEHSVWACALSKPELRLAGLLHDIGKPEGVFRDDNFHKHDEYGEEICLKILGQNGLKYPNDFVKRTARLVKEHMKDLNGDMKERKLRIYILKNADIIEDLISVKIADGCACKLTDSISISAYKMMTLLKTMREEGIPFSIKELEISGREVIDIIGEDNKNYTAKTLDKLLEYVAVKDVVNEKESLKKQVLRAFKEVAN